MRETHHMSQTTIGFKPGHLAPDRLEALRNHVNCKRYRVEDSAELCLRAFGIFHEHPAIAPITEAEWVVAFNRLANYVHPTDFVPRVDSTGVEIVMLGDGRTGAMIADYRGCHSHT